ncbi:helix-turn-helix domain-containing protein [Streptomyces thermolineatus]|uniref:Helix-turn-helix domain-containing protein n=1 Tax=Streptomyces thermolineatus TaxID=44033 RepID=A0ABN3MGI3_9ACTN
MTRRDTYVCGIDAAIDVVGGKWKVLVLWELGEGPRRFGELRRGVPGVTEKVLTSHLRELEADGIVSREEALDGAVRRVTYSLTPLGVSLNEALAPLGAWGREHLLGRQSGRDGRGEHGGHGGRDGHDEALGLPH